jgi:hypothetical protein
MLLFAIYSTQGLLVSWPATQTKDRMPVTIQIPPDIEQQLRQDDPQLDTHTRELFIIANYQAGRLGTGDIALSLGVDTHQKAERWLAQRGVRQNSSLADLETDRNRLTPAIGSTPQALHQSQNSSTRDGH